MNQTALVQDDGKLIRWNDTGVTKYFDRAQMVTEQAGADEDPEWLGEYGARVRESPFFPDRPTPGAMRGMRGMSYAGYSPPWSRTTIRR